MGSIGRVKPALLSLPCFGEMLDGGVPVDKGSSRVQYGRVQEESTRAVGVLCKKEVETEEGVTSIDRWDCPHASYLLSCHVQNVAEAWMWQCDRPERIGRGKRVQIRVRTSLSRVLRQRPLPRPPLSIQYTSTPASSHLCRVPLFYFHIRYFIFRFLRRCSRT